MVMPIPSLLFSLQILLIITFTYQTKAVYDEINNYHYFCDQSNNKANYTANSTYHKNLNTVLTTLTSNTDINYGFYNFSFGENNDKVYSIGLCRGDLLTNDCRSCLSGSRDNLTSVCPNQREAIFWSQNERCMLRYSDRLIFGIMEDVPTFHSNNENDSADVNLSNEVVTTLLNNLTSKAVKGDSRLKYAAGSLPGPTVEIIYGLVQCTPDLSEKKCNSCLVESLQQIPSCCKGKIGGRVVRPSCNMRFETSYEFYDTSPTASSSSPPPPSALSPPPNTTGKSNKSSTIGIAVAVPVAIVALVFIFVCIYFKRRKSKKKFEDQAKREELYWGMRYKIILGIARGILYLHEDSRLRIIHRDLKASNILLDEDMNPKIADFGMARLFGVDQTQENTRRIVGTYGYMAPEYAMHGEFSVKSDVFSFGILILEIVSGMKNSGVRDGESIEYLSSFAWRNWRDGTISNTIDPTLNNDSQNEIMRCIHIGLLCVQENVASRPTMNSVVVMLNSPSVTLPIPSEPAFHMDVQNFQDISSAQESINEMSNTELYPR
ncbi:cysteine-rich receptor-like protein kinase 29 isoform X2 [Vicia villosa]|uniref:cysteine-rich receptor-like protein kinase 29 isoform X2 n=1 Tax=Vicia villosa TaxID=3911 RepID=UPI00273C1FC4|nr:cysteine-rich receptor-like protein kinase 29 isoform X2 [Vicia villosa]